MTNRILTCFVETNRNGENTCSIDRIHEGAIERFITKHYIMTNSSCNRMEGIMNNAKKYYSRILFSSIGLFISVKRNWW
jgi:hypothetical protein